MNKIVKVRMGKEYPQARNHVAVGEVLEEHPQYLRMCCQTYHFGKYKNEGNVKTGGIRVRCFPWGRIAVITELSRDIPWEKTNFKLNEDGKLVLDDTRETGIEDESD